MGECQFQYVMREDNRSADQMACSLGQSGEVFELFYNPPREMIESLVIDLGLFSPPT